MEQRKNSFLNSPEIQNKLNGIAKTYPNLANNLVSLYKVIDAVCAEFRIAFPHEEMIYELRVRRIEPIIRSNGKASILGANLFLGITNDYVGSFVHAGQIMMLLSSSGGIDYETYLYKSVDSVIVGDTDLERLAKWLRITKHKLQEEINATLIRGNDRVISRRTQPKTAQPKSSQPPKVSKTPQNIPLNVSPIPKPAKNSHSIPKPKPQSEDLPLQKVGERKKKSEDELNGLIDNIPPFDIKRDHGKVTIPPDLKLTKKK